jgi:hypothetical protein
MAEPIKVNRTVAQPHMASPEMDERPVVSARQMAPARRPSRWPWLVVVIVIIVLGVGAFLFRDTIAGWLPGKTADTNKASDYQAVFLTNNQVYFGKIVKTSGDYIVLNDIYYLQVVQPPLQGSGQQTQQQNQQAQLSLIKLGGELHGPTDEMHINRSQVLFWENMKENSEVVKNIEVLKKQPATPAPTGTAPVGTPPATTNTSGSTGTSK